MPIHLNLSADEVLSTTRSVRKRLDLSLLVEKEVLEECLRLAQQAPSGSNTQNWHFVVVTDPAIRAQLGEFVQRGAARYAEFARQLPADPARDRIAESVRYLGEHIAEVPVHVIPCLEGRIDGAPAAQQAGTWACLIPAVWSFMLAARDRGLGTVWTGFHLTWEREVAEIVGIPYDDVMQAALIPVAYTVGTDFKPGPRLPLDTMTHWDRW